MDNLIKKKQKIFGRWPRQILCAVFIGGSGLAIAAPVSAQIPTQEFSKRAGISINQALSLANTGEHKKAIDVLEVELAGNDLSPIEFATIYQMMGQFNYELDKVPLAIRAFETAILSGGLTSNETENLKLVVAQLMIGNGDYRAGSEQLERLIEAQDSPKLQYIELLINAFVQADDYPRALPWAKIWFEKAEPKTKRHYDLLAFLYSELGLTEAKQKITKERADQGF